MSGNFFCLLFVFSVISTINGAEDCKADDTYCELCSGFGNSSRIDTFYNASVCSIALDVQDNNTLENIIPRCESVWEPFNVTSKCQLAVFQGEWVKLVEAYKEAGIRNNNRKMLIGMVRDNCSEEWNYETRGGEIYFAANRSETLDCDINRGAFEGLSIREVDPLTYETNAILCQCAATDEDLPGYVDTAPSVLNLVVVLLTSLLTFELTCKQ